MAAQGQNEKSHSEHFSTAVPQKADCSARLVRQKGARTRHMQCSNVQCYSMTSSARASNVGGTVQGVRGKQPKRHDPRRSGGIYHSSIEESSLPVRGSAAKIRCYLLQTKQS
jgi:hypothetical protein